MLRLKKLTDKIEGSKKRKVREESKAEKYGLYDLIDPERTKKIFDSNSK